MDSKNRLPQISAHQGALILIDMLYAERHINKATYDKIQAKYGKATKEKEADSMGSKN